MKSGAHTPTPRFASDQHQEQGKQPNLLYRFAPFVDRHILSLHTIMQNNINGGGGRRQVLSSVDFYRRVPTDLTEVSVLRVLVAS